MSPPFRRSRSQPRLVGGALGGGSIRWRIHQVEGRRPRFRRHHERGNRRETPCVPPAWSTWSTASWYGWPSWACGRALSGTACRVVEGRYEGLSVPLYEGPYHVYEGLCVPLYEGPYHRGRAKRAPNGRAKRAPNGRSGGNTRDVPPLPACPPVARCVARFPAQVPLAQAHWSGKPSPSIRIPGLCRF